MTINITSIKDTPGEGTIDLASGLRLSYFKGKEYQIADIAICFQRAALIHETVSLAIVEAFQVPAPVS